LFIFYLIGIATIKVKKERSKEKEYKWAYPGKATRFFSEGAQCLKTSSENPPSIIPGVAKRTQGPGASNIDLSNL
jgi:hypothetical protein